MGIIGNLKGIMLIYNNIFNNGYFVGEVIYLSFFDCVCIFVLFFYCFGMVMGNLVCIMYGLIMVYLLVVFNFLEMLKVI